MNRRTAALAAVTAGLLAAAGACADSLVTGVQAVRGRVATPDRRLPPPFRDLGASEARDFELGRAVFNTQFVAEGTPGAGRIDGLGPLFSASSCDACHNDGARARGPEGDGPAPIGLVVQFGPDARAGDPVYGHTLSISALEGWKPEGTPYLRYTERQGRFADGTAWSLRVPELAFPDLGRGALDPSTVIRPRLAPAAYGVGLLAAVPDEAIAAVADPADRNGDGISGRVAYEARPAGMAVGRLGWQATAVSVREQTSRALARDMGLSSAGMDPRDCAGPTTDCGDATAGAPEVVGELLDALVLFQELLAVPATGAADAPVAGAEAFHHLGCDDCHRQSLPVRLPAASGPPVSGVIQAYTDLLLHDLGPGLADRTAGGAVTTTEWRTAPLWGQRAGMRPGRTPFLLHDGRARTVAEAILWHDGEAAEARRRFERLPRADRDTLTRWVESL